MFEIALIVLLGSLIASLVSGIGLACAATRRASKAVFVVAVLVSTGTLAWLWPELQRNRERFRQKETMRTICDIGERISNGERAGTAVDGWTTEFESLEQVHMSSFVPLTRPRHRTPTDPDYS